MQICCVKGRCRCKWISTRRTSYLRSADSALSPMPSLLKLKPGFAACYDLYLDTYKWSFAVTWLRSCTASWSCFFALQRFIRLRLHIAGVSIKERGSHVQDGLKENGEVFKMLLSTLKNIVLGQRSEVIAQTRESQTGRINGCGLFRSTPPYRGLNCARGQHPFWDVSCAMLPVNCWAPSRIFQNVRVLQCWAHAM